MPTIIYRYLAKEISTTLAGLTSILLLIFFSNQLVNYLTRAAAGKIPGMIVLKLLALEIPTLLSLLLPLGLFMALLIAYGRLYADNEMTVMMSCGFSKRQLLKFTLWLAIVVSLVVGIMVFWVSPKISRDRDHLLTGGGLTAIFDTLIPGRFHSQGGGNKVLYVEKVTRDHETANDIFIAEKVAASKSNPGGWRILTAHAGNVIEDHSTSSVHLNLEQGFAYEGQPGRRDYRVASFERYQARIPEAKPHLRKVESALPVSELWPWNTDDPKRIAELNWRLAIPLMTVILAFVAVPLSEVSPREGKYKKLLPAIILYVIYANFLFVGRDAISESRFPSWVGFWPLHLFVLVIGFVLYYKPFTTRRLRKKSCD